MEGKKKNRRENKCCFYFNYRRASTKSAHIILARNFCELVERKMPKDLKNKLHMISSECKVRATAPDLKQQLEILWPSSLR